MPNVAAFRVVYDAGSDVLYISTRREAAARGIEDANGIVWRYDGAGALIGATVVDFHDRWVDHTSKLAEEISRHFHIPVPQARGVVDRGLEDRRRHH